MMDYRCLISVWTDEIHVQRELVLTIEEGIIEPNEKDKEQDIEFEREQLTRDLLLELLKEEYDEDVELICFEPVIDNNFDIYKLTY